MLIKIKNNNLGYLKFYNKDRSPRKYPCIMIRSNCGDYYANLLVSRLIINKNSLFNETFFYWCRSTDNIRVWKKSINKTADCSVEKFCKIFNFDLIKDKPKNDRNFNENNNNIDNFF